MDPDRYDGVVSAPGFTLGVRLAGERIGEIEFLAADTPLKAPQSALAKRACEQLENYLRDPDALFDLPLEPRGTAYQRRVWNAIRAIPRGQTSTYGELARRLETNPRAVGQACGANPYPLVVPCHRVVGAGGIGGFAHARDGLLVAIKHWLLRHEQSR
jgi:methylated-DNA-[protein]-cysteine S-methyltransferase